MIQNNQFTFSIAAVLGATAIIAILLAYGHIWQVAFVIGLMLAIFFGCEYLLRKLPTRVKQLQRDNCVRADGSWSEHRTATENRESRNLRSNIQTVLAIVVLPWSFLLFGESFAITYLVAFGIVWLFASFLILRSGYLYFLNRFVFNLKRRSQQYKIRDLELIIHNEEMAAIPPAIVLTTKNLEHY